MRQKIERKQQKRKHHQKPNYSYWKFAGLILLILLSFGAIFVLVNRFNRRDNLQLPSHTGKSSVEKNNFACQQHFKVRHYHSAKGKNSYRAIKTKMLQEIHGKDENKIAECLEEIAQKGDRLLIEAPDANGKAIPCDSLNPAYSRFNGKLDCFGFDAPVSKERLLFGEYSWKANFIANKIYPWVQNAKSTKEVIHFLNGLAETFAQIQLPEHNHAYKTAKMISPDFLHPSS